MTQKSSKVPKKMQARYDAVVALTDAFCRENLTDEYVELAQYMTAALARKRPSLIGSGRVKTWACSIVYALGQVNFLFERSQEPYMSAAELCELFGVAKSTGGNKAKAIRNALNFNWYDWEWSLPSRLADHPTAWFISVNGLMMDARRAPIDIQRETFEKGYIPYVYGDS